jgi:hypothetical protein
VGREPGPREILRRSLAEALARRGVVRRDAREVASGAVAALVVEGAGVLPRVVLARWTTVRRPGASLETWRTRPGLPGCPGLALSDKNAILGEVEEAFRAEFGDPEAPVDSAEWFDLEGARWTA